MLLRVASSILFALALSACRSSAADERYFGKTVPPADNRLTYEHVAEPETLDPTLATLTQEWTTIGALFEGLVASHPETLEPIAGIATHYEVNADSTQYTFFLRGHASPRGTRLPDTNSLPDEFRHGHKAAPAIKAAQWSDGRVLMARDFAFAWKRLLDPATASPNVAYAKAVKDVRALDEFTFQVDLNSPTPFFLKILWQPFFGPLREDVVTPGWAARKQFVSNGPFRIREWKPYEKIVVEKNPFYYEADLVGLDELVFRPVSDPSSYVNVYKAGEADIIDGLNVPKFFLPALRGKRDFRQAPLFMNFSYSINVTKPPADNVLIRYALNMATDKAAIAELLGAVPSKTFVASAPGYDPPAAVNVDVNGVTYDILKYDPAQAREILAHAGFPDGVGRDGTRLNIPIGFTNSPLRQIPEIIQQQWRDNLRIDVTPIMMENKVLYDSTVTLQYTGLLESSWFGTYLDPDSFLLRFPSDSLYNGTGFKDPDFDQLLQEANRTLDPAERMRKLAEVETQLLKGMPLIPVLYDTLSYLEKPYVRGMRPTPLGTPTCFKYVYIDRHFDGS